MIGPLAKLATVGDPQVSQILTAAFDKKLATVVCRTINCQELCWCGLKEKGLQRPGTVAMECMPEYRYLPALTLDMSQLCWGCL